jgi:flagellar hook-basal body complex protein FliE
MNNAILPGWPLPPTTAATTPTAPSGPAAGEGEFSATLKNAINKVEELGQDANTQTAQLLQGDRQDVHNVLIAVEKADVAFQLMMQVRNKIVSAYQDVSKLQF